jgi:endonuclease YncB( thermonuclease family)
MICNLTLLFTFLLGFSTVATAGECDHDATTFRCVKFIRNYDADTITVDIPRVHPLIGKHISVRVRHVDTPEVKGTLPCEKEAARNARRLVENLMRNAKRIDLENVDKDKYFRILADVKVDGRYIKDVLLKNNLAYVYEGKTKQKIDWCLRKPAGF